jgi:hypothetical protein
MNDYVTKQLYHSLDELRQYCPEERLNEAEDLIEFIISSPAAMMLMKRFADNVDTDSYETGYEQGKFYENQRGARL